MTNAGKDALPNTVPFDEIRVKPQADGTMQVELCHEGEPMWLFDSIGQVRPGDDFSIKGAVGQLPVTLS